jgi:uncharacterized protein YrrD
MTVEKYSGVVGLPVICVENGKRIGIVKDIIFCPTEKRVIGFLLEHRGCEIGEKVILTSDAISLGTDALVVGDCTCIKQKRKIEKQGILKEKGKIIGLKIYSKSGEDLGIVKDVLFDFRSGLVEGVELSDGLLFDLVQGRNILPLFGKVEFGEENILVGKEAVEEMMNTGGGLKKKFFE